MVENRAIKFSGDDVTIGDVTRPTSEIVSIVASGTGIRVTFRRVVRHRRHHRGPVHAPRHLPLGDGRHMSAGYIPI